MKVDPDILEQLSPQKLLTAYANGIFPMVEQGRLWWFRPDPRGLLPLDERLHVSRRLGRKIRSGRFVCTVDRRFEQVMRGCADRSEGTWISPEMILAYCRLHEMGFAHSVETWPADAAGEGPPIGGLYGVALGGAFFAESMFHAVTDAGKVALVHTVNRLRNGGFVLCDVQWATDNLRRWGAYEVSGEEYLRRLARALRRDGSFE